MTQTTIPPGFYTRTQISKIHKETCTIEQVERLKEMALAYLFIVKPTEYDDILGLQLDPAYQYQGVKR